MSEQKTLFDYLENLGRQGETAAGKPPGSDFAPGKGRLEEERASTLPAPGSAETLLQQAVSASSLEDLRRLSLTCARCRLRADANGVVFGEGHARAQIMFVGEGPGADEDRLGRPFVGAAGRLLDRIIASCSLTREGVYIANIVKCRPPRNRPPQREEIESCFPLLEKQIDLIDPLILVLLGSVATKVVLDPTLSITAARGKWQTWKARLVMPTFHPAALLRDPRKKRPVWEDMQKVITRYEELVTKET